MKIISLKYVPYSLKLKSPFHTAKTKVSVRKGFVISLSDESGVKGFGDAAPLPDFGSESYDQALKFLSNFKFNLEINLDDFENSLEQNLQAMQKFPATRHGLEQALLNYFSAKAKIPLNELLNRKLAKDIKINGVIGITTRSKLIVKVDELLKSGFTTLKVKVGRDNFKNDFDAIEYIRSKAGDKIKIRIDANGTWTPAKAVKNLQSLEKFNIEYCEQPVKNIYDFSKIKSGTKISLAADESIRSLKDAQEIIEQKLAPVIILKPMMLGGILNALKIADLAAKNKLKVIITTSFESALGRSFAILAASFLNNNLAHGLGTGGYFQKDIFVDPYPVKNGIISLG